MLGYLALFLKIMYNPDRKGEMVMDLLQFKYFYESAQSGSFSKTAQKHMVPLSSVSASIRRLEKELNCTLFDRFPNYIVLNENGKKLQKSLCVAFAEVDNVLTEITAQHNENTEIRVLVRGMRRNITDMILRFKEKFPNSFFKISFDFNATDFENFDVIIDEESDLYPQYEKAEFFSTKLRIKCGKNHPLLGKKIKMKQLCNYSFISMGEGSNLHKALIDVCNAAGFSPEISVMCNDLECYEKLIVGGIGIAIGREKSLSKKIYYLDVTDLNKRYTLYCYYPKSAYYGIVKKFVDFLIHSND
jgi:DNA-binding transcriptional LysR family regulator